MNVNRKDVDVAYKEMKESEDYFTQQMAEVLRKCDGDNLKRFEKAFPEFLYGNIKKTMAERDLVTLSMAREDYVNGFVSFLYRALVVAGPLEAEIIKDFWPELWEQHLKDGREIDKLVNVDLAAYLEELENE